MDPLQLFTLPPQWKNLSTAQLENQLDLVQTLADSITDEILDRPADEAAGSVSGMDYARSLATAKTELSTVIDTRREKAAAAAAEREQVLATLASSSGTIAAAASAAGEAPAQPAPENPETPETPETPATETEPEAPVDETPAEPDSEPAAAPATETPTEPEAQATPAQEPQATAAPPAPPVEQTMASQVPGDPNVGQAVTPARSTSQALQAMASRRSSDENPRPSSEARNGRMRAVGAHTIQGWQSGEFLDDETALAELMTLQINQGGIRGGGWDGPPTKVPLVQSVAQFSDEEMLAANDPERNFKIFETAGFLYKNANEEAMVASGAPCAPLPTTYEFETCYTPQRFVEPGVPVVGSPRGGVKYLEQVPLGGEAASAITTKTSAEAALPIGDENYFTKNCTRVACPTEAEVRVGSVTWCVTFDNLNFRVFPEQVRNMLERVQIEFIKAKEIFYLNRLDTMAGTPVAAPTSTMGAGRSLYMDIITAASNYRRRNNMAPNALLDWWIPSTAEHTLAVDMTNDLEMGGVPSIVAGPNGNLVEALARRAQVNVKTYYYDSTNAGFPAAAHDGAAGTWWPLPTTFRSFLYAPGSVVRLDGGQLDLGIVRDSTLNADNDLQMFAEQWIELARIGCEVVSFTHVACPSGVGPAPAVAPVCA